MVISRWKPRRETIWPFLLGGTITFCSGYAAVHLESDWFAPDKVGHFALYGALATAIARHPGLSRWPWLGAWWAIVLASAYGLGDEFRQSLTIVRLFEWDDWIADTLGAALAVALYLRWPWYRSWMERPVFRNRPGEAAGLAEVPSDK